MRSAAIVVAAFALVVLVSAPDAFAQQTPQAARIVAASQAYELTHAGFASGIRDPEDVYRWSVRWVASARDGAPPGPAPFIAHLERMITLQRETHQRVTSGFLSPIADAACVYFVAEARAWILRPPP